ncbi:molybdopterin-dependent oxidoreductase [Palleronia sp. LCG004]|uniref:molybdopterin-dependent oxidoreductase n=1 Tax=Palleronia sp. LCG004 TaxID=3079304 RepID=UPI0029433474|nr:molybdopterin-dependent oxidoreductase [Palleronia sp. LCG004]WOI57899.1 molybdopterin-dependent oxidoreductase [Palleronia sp. LCG004]
MRYTMSHWGTYEIHEKARGPRLKPLTGDPDPSPIGLHQLSPQVSATRVRRPAVRKSWLEKGAGAHPELRGREPFVEVDWQTAFRLVGDELDRVRGEHGNEAIFGGSYGWASAGRFHHAQSQVHRFLNVIGGYVAHRDSYSLAAARVILPHIVAPMNWLMENHNSWDDLEQNCDLFLTFGGVPAKNAQISQAGVGRHRVREGLRQMAAAGVEFVNVSPISTNLETGAPVDWVPVRPGGDTAFMLALAHELHRQRAHDLEFLSRYCTGWETFEAYLTGAIDGTPKDATWAAPLCDVPAERIRALASRMIGKRVMINIAWALQRAQHGEQPFWMVVTLAAMLGQIGMPGGGFGVGYGAENMLGSPHAALKGPSFPQGRNPVKAFIPVARLSDMLLSPGAAFRYNGGTYSYPDIRLIYWAGGNPFHHHQDLTRLERAWQKPETIIVHEQAWTATARRADIVLPASMSHEKDDIGYATLEGLLLATRAACPPEAEARSDYDIFAGIAAHMGLGEPFTEGRSAEDWVRHLYDELRIRWDAEGVELPEYDAFVARGMIDLSDRDPQTRIMLSEFRANPEAHPLSTPSGRIEIFSETIQMMDLPDCHGHATWLAPEEWLGSAGRQTLLHLISDQPERRLHSQLDASQHSGAGKIKGREAAAMHPEEAARRGLSHGQIIEIYNGRGRCLAGLCIDPEMTLRCVRLSTGAWFDPDPETGVERHGNPNVLTADVPASELSQGCTAHSCLVEVRAATHHPEVRAFDLPEFTQGTEDMSEG